MNIELRSNSQPSVFPLLAEADKFGFRRANSITFDTRIGPASADLNLAAQIELEGAT
jgi:hypothetical protein